MEKGLQERYGTVSDHIDLYDSLISANKNFKVVQLKEKNIHEIHDIY